MRLDHINLYLLDEGDGWTIVDTGLGTKTTQKHWEQIFEDCLDGRPVKRIVVTHMHPDHVGQAGWLVDRCHAPLWMSEAEYFHARTLSTMHIEKLPWQVIEFYQRAGLSAEQMHYVEEFMGAFRRAVGPMPHAYNCLDDGDLVTVGSNEWRIILCYGHAPAHACLYCEARGILISGDQVLPNISTNVSVTATRPNADPMSLWLASLNGLKDLNSDTLVLPAHNLPFYGLHERLDALINHHQEQFTFIEQLCRQPRNAMQLTEQMFRPDLTGINLILGVGECIAHLHCLMKQQRIERQLDDGLYVYHALQGGADTITRPVSDEPMLIEVND